MKRFVIVSVLAVFGFMFLLSANILAKEKQDAPVDLGNITVTAAKKATPVENVSESVEIITREQIEAMPLESIDDLISTVAGVVSERTDVNSDAKGGVKVRGQSSDSGRVLVLVDGMIMNNGDSGSANFSTVDIDNVERVEIIRGASSVLHGTNGMGGVVNIITKRPTGEFKASTSFEGGSKNTYKEGLAFEGGISDNFAYYFSASNKRSGWYNSDYPEDRDAANVGDENTTIEERRYNLKGVHSIGDADTTLTYSVRVYDDERFRGEAYNLANNPMGSAWSFDTQRYQFDYKNPGQRFSSQFSIGCNLEKYERYSERLKRNRYTHWVVSSDRLNYGLDGSASWTRGNHDLTLGAGYSVASQDAKDDYKWSNDTDVRNDPAYDAFNKGDLDTVFGYFHDSVVLSDSVDVQVGLRFDDASTKDTMYNLSQSTQTVNLTGKGWNHISPKLGFIFFTGPNSRARVQYNHAFHAPTLESMTLNMQRGGSFWHSNPSLEPETTDAFEIGLDHNGKRYSHSFNIFYNRAEDYIDIMDCTTAMGCPATEKKYMNVGRVDFNGTEFETSLDTTENTRFYFNVSYVKSEIKEYLADTTLVGNQLTLTPKITSNMGFYYSRTRDESLSMNIAYRGSSYDDSNNTIKQNANFALDIKASKWMSDKDVFELQLNNLFQNRRLDGRSPSRLPGELFTIGYTRHY